MEINQFYRTAVKCPMRISEMISCMLYSNLIKTIKQDLSNSPTMFPSWNVMFKVVRHNLCHEIDYQYLYS